MSADLSKRIIPAPIGLNAEFYRYLAQNELRLQRCTSCGTWRHPPRHLCAPCGSPAVEWARASGRARVFSWTVTHRAVDPAFTAPYAIVSPNSKRDRDSSATCAAWSRAIWPSISRWSSRSSTRATRSGSFGSARPDDRRSDRGAPGRTRERASFKDEVAMDGRRARIVLGVSDDAGPDEIRRAFRARARLHHPDHGGDAETFALVKDAFDVLRFAPTPRVPVASRVRVDVYDSVRPKPRRDFADLLRAATARFA
jgi:hypothetical protein